MTTNSTALFRQGLSDLPESQRSDLMRDIRAEIPPKEWKAFSKLSLVDQYHKLADLARSDIGRNTYLELAKEQLDLDQRASEQNLRLKRLHEQHQAEEHLHHDMLLKDAWLKGPRFVSRLRHCAASILGGIAEMFSMFHRRAGLLSGLVFGFCVFYISLALARQALWHAFWITSMFLAVPVALNLFSGMDWGNRDMVMKEKLSGFHLRCWIVMLLCAALTFFSASVVSLAPSTSTDSTEGSALVDYTVVEVSNSGSVVNITGPEKHFMKPPLPKSKLLWFKSRRNSWQISQIVNGFPAVVTLSGWEQATPHSIPVRDLLGRGPDDFKKDFETKVWQALNAKLPEVSNPQDLAGKFADQIAAASRSEGYHLADAEIRIDLGSVQGHQSQAHQ